MTSFLNVSASSGYKEDRGLIEGGVEMSLAWKDLLGGVKVRNPCLYEQEKP